MSDVGADVPALTDLASRLAEAAHRFEQLERALTHLYATSMWRGPAAAGHRRTWMREGSPRLRHLAAAFTEIARSLGDQADDQQRASATRVVRPLVSRWRDTSRFVADGEPIAAITSAMGALGDEQRVGRDEIEVRALDSGRYVVVLPGVTDLSEGGEHFLEQLRARPLDPVGVAASTRAMLEDNSEPTVRKMRHAVEAAFADDHTVNEYSLVTMEALRRAGVPSGSEVLLIGHSFGAYAAMDIAASPGWNEAHGAGPTGYRLDVRGVIAAGADTDWRLDEIPAATRTLILNNRLDAIYRAENLLHDDGDPEHVGHLEHDFWGGFGGFGHDEQHYIDAVSDMDHPEVSQWLFEAGHRFGGGGIRFSLAVPDPVAGSGPATANARTGNRSGVW